jgi:hypothetical protein
VTDTDIDRIGLALAIILPESYRQFMLAYPDWLLAKQPAWSDVARWELADNADRVISFNQEVRNAELGEFFDDGPWPPHYFVIGSERGQNWFYLDLASESDAVWMFHHEEGELRLVAVSLAEFPAALVAWWEGVEADSK